MSDKVKKDLEAIIKVLGNKLIELRKQVKQQLEHMVTLTSQITMLTSQKKILIEQLKKYKTWIADLIPLGEPPLFPAIFLSLSEVDDPRRTAYLKKTGIDYKKCRILTSDGTEVVTSAGNNIVQNLLPGQLVYINNSMNVVALVPELEVEPLRMLHESVVYDVIGSLILVSGKDNKGIRAIVVSKELQGVLAEKPLEAGDRILLFANCIMRILERSKLTSEKENIRKKSFTDIGGLDKERQEIMELLSLTKTNDGKYLIDSEGAQKMGLEFPRGAILFGPPGCGKDLFVSALANELGWPLHVMNGPDITSMWVGEAPRIMREIFDLAQKQKPSLLFVNEADSLFPVRGKSFTQEHKTDYTAQFNVKMNSVEDTTGVFVILATNRLDQIDEAVIRPGRFDKRIFIPRPDKKAAEVILKIHLNKHPIVGDNENVCRSKWINQIVEELYAIEERTFLFKAFWQNGENRDFYFKDFISGALLENIIDTGARKALTRLRENGTKPDDPNFGIIEADMTDLVSGTLKRSIPRDRESLRQWLIVNGCPEASSFRGGIFDEELNETKD